MQYPLIDRQWITGLRIVHGLYNTLVMVLFLYHGWLGLTIRRARKAGKQLPFPAIKRHRRAGPFLAGAGITGFFIGFSTVMLHTGKVLEYPEHLFTGLAIVLLLSLTFVLSRQIKGPVSAYRTPHAIIGAAILCLYMLQVFIGIGVLF
jgi:hypothetical protein